MPVSSTATAEFTKIFENTFRSVNIALVNELAILCDRININIWEVLDAAYTKPFGMAHFFPGPGVGGHCIPLDPLYLEWKAKEMNGSTQFISLASSTNRRMPNFTISKTTRILNEMGLAMSRSKILVLGASYKQNLPDCRESPAIIVMQLLKKHGADLCYHDPYVPDVSKYSDLNLKSVPLTAELIQSQDMVIILTAHANMDYDQK